MDEENTQELSWKVVFVIIAVVLIASLFLTYLFFKLLQDKRVQLPEFPQIPAVLGTTQSSTSPSPNTIQPTPVVSPSPTSQATASLTQQLQSQPSLPWPSSPTLALPITDSFENGLGSWTASGDVFLIDQLKNPDSFSKPFSGTHMVRIGRPSNQGFPISQNKLQIPLPVNSRKLSFAYRFFSYDYQGFDSPGFSVLIDDQHLFDISAAEIDKDSTQTDQEKLDSTTWLQKTIELSQFSSEKEIRLTFEAGNDEVNIPTQQEHQSWVYLDSIKIE